MKHSSGSILTSPHYSGWLQVAVAKVAHDGRGPEHSLQCTLICNPFLCCISQHSIFHSQACEVASTYTPRRFPACFALLRSFGRSSTGCPLCRAARATTEDSATDALGSDSRSGSILPQQLHLCRPGLRIKAHKPIVRPLLVAATATAQEGSSSKPILAEIEISGARK